MHGWCSTRASQHAHAVRMMWPHACVRSRWAFAHVARIAKYVATRQPVVIIDQEIERKHAADGLQPMGARVGEVTWRAERARTEGIDGLAVVQALHCECLRS